MQLVVSCRGPFGAVGCGARLDGGEVEHVDLAAGTLQQVNQMMQALRVLQPERICGKDHRPELTLPAEHTGTHDDGRLRPPVDVQVSQACRDLPCQCRHPELLAGPSGQAQFDRCALSVAGSVALEEHRGKVETSVRRPRSRSHPLVHGDRVAEMTLGVVELGEGVGQQAEVAGDGSDASLGSCDRVAAVERQQLFIQHGRPLDVPKAETRFAGEGHAEEPLDVSVQDPELADGEFVEHGSCLVMAAQVDQQASQGGAVHRVPGQLVDSGPGPVLQLGQPASFPPEQEQVHAVSGHVVPSQRGRLAGTHLRFDHDLSPVEGAFQQSRDRLSGPHHPCLSRLS